MSSRPSFPSRRLVPLALVAAAAFAVGAFTQNHALRLASKPWPVVLLALWVARAAPADRYRGAMLLGLGCSLAGDMFLEVSPRGLFLPGLVSFLVAHVFYVVAYLEDARAAALLRAIPAYLYGAALVVALRPGLGRLTVPVAVYTVVICTMIWRAAARSGRVAQTSARLALVGAVTFAFSDSLIAVGRFGGHLVAEPLRTSTAWRLAIMSTYWLGQWAIAAAAVTRGSRGGPQPS